MTSTTLKQDFAGALDGMMLFQADEIGNVEYMDDSEVASELIEILVDRMEAQGFPESVIDAVLGDREEE